ncbi:hypothetical protein BJ166DRAFT_530235, partial [Pestalotiopsis sp. NC0098]
MPFVIHRGWPLRAVITLRLSLTDLIPVCMLCTCMSTHSAVSHNAKSARQSLVQDPSSTSPSAHHKFRKPYLENQAMSSQQQL